MPSPVIDTQFDVVVDHVQRRLSRKPLGVFAEGSYPAERGGRVTGWDLVNSTNVWQDPITYTAFMQPGPLSPSWPTTTTGIFARYRIADLDFTSASGWSNVDVPGNLHWLHKPQCSNDYLTTKETLPINTGMFLAWHTFAGADDFVAMECGWSDDNGFDIGLRFYVGGKAELWKGDALLAEGKYSGATASSRTSERWVGVMIIPCRNRELLIVSTEGAGFAHAFADLDEDGTVKTITPATKFWAKIPTGTATVQMARIRYPSSATLYSEPLAFADAPPLGIGSPDVYPFTDSQGSGTAAVAFSLVDNGSPFGAFTPDGSEKWVRIKGAMTSDNTASPHVYGAAIEYPAEYANTADAEESIPWQDLRICFPDEPFGVTAEFNTPNPADVAAPKFKTLNNRPIKVSVGTAIILDGRTRDPEVMEAAVAEAQVLSVKAVDYGQALRDYRFRDKVPLTGWSFAEAIEYLVSLPGMPIANIHVEDTGLTIDAATGCTAGEWSPMIDVGDTPADWIERLFEGRAGDWFYGLIPEADGVHFRAMPPDLMSTTPDVILHKSRTAAIAQLISEGASEADAVKFCRLRMVSSFRHKTIAPEANEIRISGYNPRTGRIIASFYRDAASQDPTTAPEDRPDNWWGEPLLFGYQDSILSTQFLTDEAAAIMADRITRTRTLAQMSGQTILLPSGAALWRGHLVEHESANWRVRSGNFSVITDAPDDGFQHRPASYAVEKMAEGDPWGISTGGVSTMEIAQGQLNRLKAISRTWGMTLGRVIRN